MLSSNHHENSIGIVRRLAITEGELFGGGHYENSIRTGKSGLLSRMVKQVSSITIAKGPFPVRHLSLTKSAGLFQVDETKNPFVDLKDIVDGYLLLLMQPSLIYILQRRIHAKN